MVKQYDEYTIERPHDDGGFDLTAKEEKERDIAARDEDHLMVLFQYYTYNFRNLQHIDPVPDLN